MTRIAILRCQDLPSFITWDIPDIDELFAEDDLLIAGFRERGLEASSVVWLDAGVDWDQFDAALIRSTWDYIDHPQEFIRVLERIDSSSCRLFNPLKVVRWNSHKRYLFDLQKWVVATVPTYSASVSAAASLERVFDKRGWEWAILKAPVGAGASDVHRVRSREIAE